MAFKRSAGRSQVRSLRRISFCLAGLAFLALFIAKIEINTGNPWFELQLMAQGFTQPSFLSLPTFFNALLTTLAFAFQAVFVAALLGFLMALCFQNAMVRAIAAFVRSVHELFWALLFIQISGLSSLTGFLALLIPFSGIFAKVFAEILDETDKTAERSLNSRSSYLSKLFYTQIILAWPQLKSYCRYRLECAIRSSAILGFVGLPTLGFELESFLKQGEYSQAAAILYVFFLLIASLKYWVKIALLPLYAFVAFLYLPPIANISWPLVMIFLTQDIVPTSLQQGNALAFYEWLTMMWKTQISYGILNSLVLSQIALICTGLLALIIFPFSSSLFFPKIVRAFGQSGLIIIRSCPEYLLAFMGLLIWGPSMLPAIVALSLHNGAVIAHLLALQSQTLVFRKDVCHGVDRYFYEALPRLYGSFIALLLYRWETILRETAILGMLGIPTLGFYIDSAFEEIRFDRAILLILVTALLNILVDNISRYCRKYIHIKYLPQAL
ncbi:MAG: phosphonate transport system permease protein [Flavobacteriales bacterium]|jgi:phosphonate transport system permease protein